jgi:defect-in-organelle-trafficking protein DotA
LIAREQFGVPLTASGTVCNSYADSCVIWGPLTSGSGVLFNGTEFQGAISDYNGIMTPTLNLMNMANQSTNQTNTRAFITNATNQGWIMAGSYFFDLVALNGNAASTSAQTDSGTNLESSTFGFSGLTSGTCNNGAYPLLCTWVGNSTTLLVQVQAALDGTYASAGAGGVPVAGTAQPVPQLDINSIASSKVVNSLASSSVYGFINNSMMMQVQGQSGLAPLQFANMIHFSVDPQTYYLKEQNFDCGSVKIVFFSFCLGRMMGNLFYNVIFRYIYNAFLAMFSQIINQVIMSFLMIPLQGMSTIFKEGLHTVNSPGVNPIVALANMGVMYINFSSNLWLMLLNMAITSAIIPLFGLFIFALIALAMPLLLAWIGIMVSVGFTTAYYIPILPYMIFTFGTLAWMISVIEAMVAAPIVALGVTHPDGHDAFGKGEAAIMILMNIFLRPALMIIGYIAAIALCYVGVWLLNAGFDHAISYIQSSPSADPNACKTSAWGMCKSTWSGSYGSWEKANVNNSMDAPGSGTGTSMGVYQPTQYNDWAGIYAYFFSILIYTTMYLVIVQKSFTLISMLPDKVLRWIGGTPESIGQEASQWGEEVKTKTGEAGKATQDAQGQMGNKLGGYGQKALGGMSKPGGSGKAKLTGDNQQSNPSPE